MTNAKRNYPFLSMLILACSLLTPVVAKSQCMVANTGMTTFGTLKIVTKTLSASYNCMLTMMNASFCFPAYTPVTTPQLVASAYTATVSPSCAWSCACGPVTIDGSDGLPVELMGFSVEDSVVSGSVED